MGRVEGKVALVTGAARGQGRSHALRLAEEGADVIMVDACSPISSAGYEMPSAADLEETVRLVSVVGRRAFGRQADVRDFDTLAEAIGAGVGQLGGLDIVCANAGFGSVAAAARMPEEVWQETIDVDLGGQWKTCKAAIPHLIESGGGGSIVITGSVAALRGYPNASHYVAAKHGLVGLTRALANELAESGIRVNSVHPANVRRESCQAEPGGTNNGAPDEAAGVHLQPIEYVEPVDVSNAVLFLASDEARYVTGVALPVDGGAHAK